MGAVLLTDYIKYDKNTKFFQSKVNIKFVNKNQILTADYFEYNFSEKSGFIENIYRVIDLEKFRENINLRKDNIIYSKRNPIGLIFKKGFANSSILNFNNLDT